MISEIICYNHKGECIGVSNHVHYDKNEYFLLIYDVTYLPLINTKKIEIFYEDNQEYDIAIVYHHEFITTKSLKDSSLFNDLGTLRFGLRYE